MTENDRPPGMCDSYAESREAVFEVVDNLATRLRKHCGESIIANTQSYVRCFLGNLYSQRPDLTPDEVWHIYDAIMDGWEHERKFPFPAQFRRETEAFLRSKTAKVENERRERAALVEECLLLGRRAKEFGGPAGDSFERERIEKMAGLDEAAQAHVEAELANYNPEPFSTTPAPELPKREPYKPRSTFNPRDLQPGMPPAEPPTEEQEQ